MNRFGLYLIPLKLNYENFYEKILFLTTLKIYLVNNKIVL